MEVFNTSKSTTYNDVTLQDKDIEHAINESAKNSESVSRKEVGEQMSKESYLTPPSPKSDDSDKIDITQADKDSFLSCLVSGDRYIASSSIFGGSIVAEFRCRSAEETSAILSYLSRCISSGLIRDDKEYSQALRIALLTAQVAALTINGNRIEFEPLKKPLNCMATPVGISKTGWEEDLDKWKSKPDGLIFALSSALYDFETKYWYMVNKSKSENFWNPAGSIDK